jgi:hypothetical protein
MPHCRPANESQQPAMPLIGRAASGHTVAAPPSSNMKSRRSLDHLVGELLEVQRHVRISNWRGSVRRPRNDFTACWPLVRTRR